MSDVTNKIKDILQSGIRVVNKAATTVAGATRYKLDELDRVSRRREAIAELGEKVYAMYQAGTEMPEEALPLLIELADLDKGLAAMREEHAKAKQAKKGEQKDATQPEEVVVEAVEEVPAEVEAVPVVTEEAAPVQETEDEMMMM